MDQNRLTVKNNLTADSLLLVLTKKWTPDYDPYHIGYAATYDKKNAGAVKILNSNGNKIIDADPGFVDVARENFQLKSIRRRGKWALKNTDRKNWTSYRSVSEKQINCLECGASAPL